MNEIEKTIKLIKLSTKKITKSKKKSKQFLKDLNKKCGGYLYEE